MAVNVDLQVLTQPGATGNQTYSLAANFDPKAVLLWATPRTADGSGAHMSFGVGASTYRSAGITDESRFAFVAGEDAATSANVGWGNSNGSVLSLGTPESGAPGTQDLDLEFISMQGGGTSQVVLNWNNLHATASIRVFMLVIGGSDVTDALSSSFTMDTSAQIQDVTVASGFGKPELLFFFGAGTDALGSATTPKFHFGFCKQGEAGRGFGFSQVDGNTASLTAMRQLSDRCITSIIATGASAGTDQALGRLDTTVANWPTDGFRVLYDANPVAASVVSFLAIRMTAQITTGANTAVIAGTPPVTQDNNAGFVPKLGFLFGWNLAQSASMQTAAADQCGFGIGAYDGATEGWAGFTEDDAAGTMQSNTQQSTAKVLRNYTPVTPALVSEADGVFSGNNFRLSWNDIDTVAREYQWLAIGDSASSGNTYTKTGFGKESG